jgi:hypothetical protein
MLLEDRKISVALQTTCSQSVISVQALFIFIERVVITQQPCEDEDTIYIPEGMDLRLECRAFGLPPPRYVWFKGNGELKDQTSSILLVRDFR